jgi:hypothetical protein
MIPQLYTHQGGREERGARRREAGAAHRLAQPKKKESDDVNECVLPDLPALDVTYRERREEGKGGGLSL